MSLKYKNLLSPLRIGNFVFKNRMTSSNSLPHFLQGPESFPADSVITHLANRAKSGAAVVTAMGMNNGTRGASMKVDFDEEFAISSDGTGNQLPMDLDFTHFPDFDLYDPASQNYLIQLADSIHFYDSIACMGFFVGPASCFPILQGGEVKQIDAHKPVEWYDKEKLELIADSYAQQIGILQKLGFDMASIHMCYRGQLISQFLSPLKNNRTDKFGGSLENRARFPMMVLKKVRETVGKNFLIELLFSGREPEGGYTLDDAVSFLKMADDYVDIVQVRAPEVDPNHPTGFELQETPYLADAAYIKKSGVNMKVAAIAGFQDFDTCEKALADGKADLIAMARSWISNPDYGKLAYEGRKDDMIPCIRCNKCHGRGKDDVFLTCCSVNPIIGLEHRIEKMIDEPTTSKKVAIIGGGPGGMKTAMDLADRGHKVTLFEATDQLGGAIKHSDYVDFKWPLRQFKDYLIHQVNKRDIDIKMNTKATPEMVKEGGFDTVVAALGAVPIVPSFPGADSSKVVYAIDAFDTPEKLGQNVVVIGGGEVGVEAGMVVAKTGRNVTVIEMRDTLAPDSTLIHYKSMFQDAWEAIPTFSYKLNACCMEISDEGVRYKDKDGNEAILPADNVVLSIGSRNQLDDALAFSESADGFYIVGDCKAPATVQQTMRSAYSTAVRL